MMGWLTELVARAWRDRPQLELPGVEFHDRRREAAQTHHGYPTRRRLLSRVTGICLHQTGCHMGERPARYDGMGAHVGVTRQGRVIWLHDFNRRVIAANGWNDGTVSVEIDGLYAGVEGGPVWDNPATAVREQAMTLTPEAVLAAQQVVRWIVASVPSVRVIVAHRQASASRRSDPGEAIWKSVALTSGLETANETTLGDGRPIPMEWDARSRARY